MTRPKMDSSWRPGVAECLKHYVYLLSDPRDRRVFYVGEGVDDRCFAHVIEARRTTAASSADYPKLAQIRQIEDAGYSVGIEILRHGLEPEIAFIVESAAIDLLGLAHPETQTEGTLNRVLGHGAASFGRTIADELNAEYGAKPFALDPAHRVVLVRIAREFYSGITPDALYNATRSGWRVDRRRRALGTSRAPEWAMAVYRGVVRAVYRIDDWEPATSATSQAIAANPNGPPRWDIRGEVDSAMQERYEWSDVTTVLPQSAQNPLRYLNCG
jgi:uncharacterized protein